MLVQVVLVALLSAVRVEADNPELKGTVERVASGVAALRQLPFKKTISVGMMAPDELKATLEKKLRKELPDDQIDGERMVLSKLGIIPAHTNLKGLYSDLLGEQIAGLYDPDSKKLFLISERPQVSSEQDSIIMAHELTHALQDQYYDVDDLVQPVRGNDDRTLAANCLAEGDATVAMLEYTIQQSGAGPIRAYITSKLTDIVMSNMDLILLVSGAIGQDQFSKAPRFIQNQLVFPYTGGLGFVRYGIGRGNWQTMNRVYASPPLSTEQIMHPAKYYMTPDWPTEVLTPGIDVYLPGKWHMAARAVLGELGTKVVLEEHPAKPPIPSPDVAAEGWDGDEINVYQNHERPDDLLLVWYSTWDSEKDADDFERAMAAWVGQRYRAAQPLFGMPQRWTLGLLRIRLERRGRDVLYMDGFHGDFHDDIARAIWAKTWKEELKPIHRRIDAPVEGRE